MFVLDTCTVSKLMQAARSKAFVFDLDKWANGPWYVSAVGLCENFNGIQLAKNKQQRESLRQRLDIVLEQFVEPEILPFDQQDMQIYQTLRNDLRSSGLSIDSDYDVMIAAQAKARGFAVVTLDQDFRHLEPSGVQTLMIQAAQDQ